MTLQRKLLSWLASPSARRAIAPLGADPVDGKFRILATGDGGRPHMQPRS
ncbi:hypothetical protein ACFQS1_32690 [Paractinoplanes rhizophilus]|jgi:hypothetical protein|uniref:Uncharacterized protein n=1 Tax=Paractinoplanes rhizophilus TaxID=1416877 RepID=A0ABW2I1L4_9ACTN